MKSKPLYCGDVKWKESCSYLIVLFRMRVALFRIVESNARKRNDNVFSCGVTSFSEGGKEATLVLGEERKVSGGQ